MLLGVSLPIVIFEVLVVVGRGFWSMRSTAHPSVRETPVNILIPPIVPFYFHFFFLSMPFVAGIVVHLPVLVGISLAMIVVSLVLHGWLVWQKLILWKFLSSQSALASETVKH